MIRILHGNGSPGCPCDLSGAHVHVDNDVPWDLIEADGTVYVDHEGAYIAVYCPRRGKHCIGEKEIDFLDPERRRPGPA